MKSYSSGISISLSNGKLVSKILLNRFKVGCVKVGREKESKVIK